MKENMKQLILPRGNNNESIETHQVVLFVGRVKQDSVHGLKWIRLKKRKYIEFLLKDPCRYQIQHLPNI